MEVGKLVTSEACGNIFYFVVDETHPDEPQPDASKCYYVVAPAMNTFSYREAYCVLCRALCGLENRTYLHRWHALHDQIFGTTPYVQFVCAVRDSPLTVPNRFGHVGAATSDDSSASSAVVTLPALFLDETTARLALHKAERGRQASIAATAATRAAKVPKDTTQPPPCSHAPLAPPPTQQEQHAVLHGCSTPVSKPQLATRIDGTTAQAANGVGKERTTDPVPQDAKEVQPPKEARSSTGIDGGKLDALLAMASRWQEVRTAVTDGGAAVIASHDDERCTLVQLQEDLRHERRQRLEAEERCLCQTRALDEALAAARRPQQPLLAPASVDDGAEQQKKVQQLQQQVQRLETEMSDTKKRHTVERDRMLAETEVVKEQLRQLREAQAAQIKDFLDENAGAVKRVEEALEKREKEVCAVYTQALEERDVRIAQLSQEVLQHLHSSRQLAASRSDQDRMQAERVAHLEDMASQLKEWNAALRRQVDASAEEIRDLRQRLQVALQKERDQEQQERYPPATSQYNPSQSQLLPLHPSQSSSSSSLLCGVCGGLPHAAAVQLATHLREAESQLQLVKAHAEEKARELHRAAQVIEQLMRGVQKAKLDVDAFRFQCLTNPSQPLQNVTLSQNIV